LLPRIDAVEPVPFTAERPIIITEQLESETRKVNECDWKNNRFFNRTRMFKALRKESTSYLGGDVANEIISTIDIDREGGFLKV
jgi:hypothetical protein